MRRGCSLLLVAAVVAAALLPASHACAGELIVSAASSLTNAFREIGATFEKTRGGDVVRFNFGASDLLLVQIARGAPVDVFAAADQEAMRRALAQALVDPATRFDFARNRLVVVVPAGGKGPASLQELAGPAFGRIAVSQPGTVPAGRYAKGALEQAGLWAAIEPKMVPTQNVRQSLDYVARGECDAGFVYATDAATFPDKVRIAFTVDTPTPVLYPAAIVRTTAQRDLADAFVAFLRGTTAQAILVRHGFGAP